MQRGVKYLLLAGWLMNAPAAMAAAPADINEQLAARISAVQQEYHTAYRAIVERVNRQFGADYEALHRAHQAHYEAYRQKSALVDQMEEGPRQRAARRELEAFFKDPDRLRYVEMRLVLENELERDHLLRARLLAAYEEMLDRLIEGDPLLRYFFQSPAYADAHGLLMKRMVWELAAGTSSSTTPLSAYAVFADRQRTPYLITLTPVAFDSLPFLRSILIHELNHVLMDKEAFLAGAEHAAATPSSAPSGDAASPYSRFFNLRFGGSSNYQHSLLHEYYSFKAQLLYDDEAPRNAAYRLPEVSRRYIESLAEWSYNELSPENKAFVQGHPTPPIEPYVQLLAGFAAPRRQ